MSGTTTASPPVKTTFWTMDRVADALAGVSVVNLPRDNAIFSRVWTDTRTIEPGDLFVALIGERFDAHEFLAQAKAKGAAGVVVSRVEGTRGLGIPVYQVTDTLVALGALGTYRRRAWNNPVVAVVGTNGKTSTKELLKAALGRALRVHATAANLNNLIGVPLTLLAVPDDAQVAVVEMGTNQPGEIARLRAIVEPDITVVTSIAEEHLEGLGDLSGVMREELSAAASVPLTVVPASQPEVVAAAKALGGRVLAAGLDAGDIRPSSWSVDPDGRGRLTLEGPNRHPERSDGFAAPSNVSVHLPLRGVHNLQNALLSFAVADALGVSPADAARGIEAMSPPPMRVHIEQHGAATLINDAYNSNPGSARAAIELLRHAGAGRQRVAVLATMLELGSQTARLHDEIARDAIGDGIDIVAAIGEFAASLGRIAVGDPRVITADDVDALWSKLSSRLEPNAVILLKGSRGMRLERLVDPIARWAATRQTP
jgi:UDP-N-acetylmuramoyl-tripeptide--D-alanyl-D-alanine ligase